MAMVGSKQKSRGEAGARFDAFGALAVVAVLLCCLAPVLVAAGVLGLFSGLLERYPWVSVGGVVLLTMGVLGFGLWLRARGRHARGVR